MINKKFMIIAIFLVGLVAISAVSAAENVDDQVISSDDSDGLIMYEGDAPGDGENEGDGEEHLYGSENAGQSNVLEEEDDDGEITALLSLNTTEIKRGDYVYVKAVNNKTNAPLANVNVGVFMGVDLYKATTNSQGIGSFRFLGSAGTYDDIIVGLWESKESVSNEVNGMRSNFIENATINVLPIDVHFKVTKSGSYFGDTTLNFLVSYDGGVLPNEQINVEFSNGKYAVLHTNSQGKATYSVPFSPGTYSLTAYLDDEDDVNPVKLSNFKIVKAPGKITAAALSTVYGSGKSFKVTLTNTATKKPIANVKINVKVYTGKKYKIYELKTNSKGIAWLPISKLSVTSHKVDVYVKDTKNVKAASVKSSIKIAKATLAISAPKVTNCYKLDEYFKVTVKNKNTKSPMSGVKVTIKVYTGKKYKTFTKKTNANGVVGFSTKSLSLASHKVVINIKGTSNFKKASAKSTIKVAKLKYPTKIIINDARWVDLGYYHIKFTLKDVNNKVLAKKKVKLWTDVYAFGSYGYTTKNVVTTNSKGVVDVTLNIIIGGGNVNLVAKTIFDGDNFYKASKAWAPVN